MKSGHYPYATGDLLDDRHNYFYTPYEGLTFLKAWEEDRNRVLASLPAPQPAPRTNGCPEFREGDRIDTISLLEFLCHKLESSAQEIPDSVRPWLDRLLQRFEVNKRLHDEYDSHFHPNDRNAFRRLDLYLRFAEVMAAAHHRTSKLTYLNVLLKCLDTLSALRDRLDKAGQARLAHLILEERRFVRAVAEKVKVKL